MPKPKKHDPRNDRPDHQPGQRAEYERNRKRILVTASVCAICGKLLFPELKYPDPMATVIDHIIPVSKGGHPSALSNLQAAHAACNRLKSDRLFPKLDDETKDNAKLINNRDLPWAIDWLAEAEGKDTEDLRRDAEILHERGYIITADGIKADPSKKYDGGKKL